MSRFVILGGWAIGSTFQTGKLRALQRLRFSVSYVFLFKIYSNLCWIMIAGQFLCLTTHKGMLYGLCGPLFESLVGEMRVVSASNRHLIWRVGIITRACEAGPWKACVRSSCWGPDPRQAVTNVGLVLTPFSTKTLRSWEGKRFASSQPSQDSNSRI